jgi:hypothetical protein
MTESYEQLRDQATGEGAEAWRRADHEQSKLRALYITLKEDPRYSEEHKAQQAWAAYEESREKIAGGHEKARELLAKQARSGERMSIPVPDGEGLITKDTTKLLASQNEASRIVRKIDRIANSAKGCPLKPDILDVLRQEYGRGLEVGGAQGGIVCRGVLAAADELGIDAHMVVDGFRKDRHRESLERAEHSERLVQFIGGRVPEPPFARPGGKGSKQRNRSGALFILRNRPALHARSRPSWR